MTKTKTPASDNGSSRTTTPIEESSSSFRGVHVLFSILYWLVCGFGLYGALVAAYEIRLYALHEYGIVIHEFDPYFNYRATEYLWEHGWKAFSQWFDYQVWYPLGRPVGTTIYPGMQVTAVFLKSYMMPLSSWSINDICCFIPTWFGVTATMSTAALAYACCSETNYTSLLQHVPIVSSLYHKVLVKATRVIMKHVAQWTGSTWGLVQGGSNTSKNKSSSSPALESALFAAAIMSIVPAHLMRSVGGGYDNESVATTAMVTTFACWVQSLHAVQNNNLWITLVWGTLTGLAYFYMVAAWGGYVFTLNLIGLHAAFLVGMGRYSTKLYCAYTTFYLVGTALAIQVPVVGWTPLKSLEQLGPLGVFGIMQMLQLCRILQNKRYNNNKGQQPSLVQIWMLRATVMGVGALVASPVVYYLWSIGYFGPISARVRGLFVQHTRTGNPLVDSVAEHQAASAGAYVQYLGHFVCYMAPVGYLWMALCKFNDSSSFLLVYGAATSYFSHRMVRLILLTAPIASVLGGIALGHFFSWTMVSSVFGQDHKPNLWGFYDMMVVKKQKNDDDTKKTKEEKPKDDLVVPCDTLLARCLRVLLAWVVFTMWIKPFALEFYEQSHAIAKQLSHPSIIQKAQLRSGEEVLVDDYRDAYYWLADHTPEDARIMAWWDYGYQITAMGNRTTIADGNTWNHEHIALLGRALTSPEREGHRIARHLADYVLLWTGGGGDDLAKSPHLARIANSVYRHMCPGDPTCRSFGLMHDGSPTPMMEQSLLYKLHSHKLVPGVEADRNRFKEVYKSKYGKVRIFKILSVSKESKTWVADPANRLCDAPGSWYCPGQYPPGLQKILKEKKDFRQLEDFNVDREHDAEYQKKYMENLNNPEKAKQQAMARKNNGGVPSIEMTRLSQPEIDRLNQKWQDSEMTTLMWQLVAKDDRRGLREALEKAPALAHIRSGDGRGPMWWAHEFGRKEMIMFLKKLGVSETLRDVDGMTPLELSKHKGDEL